MQDLQREIENIVKDELKRKLHGGSLYYGKAHENRNLLGGLMLADGKKIGGLMLADGKKAKKRHAKGPSHHGHGRGQAAAETK